MAVAEQPLTLEAFLDLPDKKPALEFEEGTVSQKVSPKGKHSLIQFAVAEALTAAVLCVLLAMTVDLLIVGAGWLITPWRRSR